MRAIDKIIVCGMALLALLPSCKRVSYTPRPTIPLVHQILSDTSGTKGLIATACERGAKGSIAIIGEPLDAITLSRHFRYADAVDNVDGHARRDSLPDFAGEQLDIILDAFYAPYGDFATEFGADSLREAAVYNAVFAWDSLCYRSVMDRKPLLHKRQAKMLIYTSSLNHGYGLFDVDTLRQLIGSSAKIVSPLPLMLEKALEGGAKNLAVWTNRPTAEAGVWEAAFDAMDRPADASLTVLAPEKAFDIRTEFRSLLRQYRSRGGSLDVLLLDSYQLDLEPLKSELSLIRMAGGEEDGVLDKLLAPSFYFLSPVSVALDYTYRYLRENHLFTHRIARPSVAYYETGASPDGTPILVEAAPSYIQRAYVPDLH